jgi:carbamoyl-phosphate synthase large subunit
MHKRNILITSAGRRVSLTRFFQAALKSSGAVICGDADPGLSSACQVADRWVKLPRVDSHDFEQKFLETCQSNEIRLVVPTIDTELLLFAQMRKKFLDHGIQIIVSDLDLIQTCRDKRKTMKFFAANKIDAPLLYDKENLHFPVFVKPYDGSRSVDTFLAKNPNEIKLEALQNEKLMFLEAIDQKENSEVTIDLYYDRNSNLKCIVPRQRLEVRDGEVNKAITVDDGIVEYMKERLSHLPGARGCLNIQVFKNNSTNELKGIEINPRFGGGFPLSYRSGALFPDYIVSEYLDDKEIPFNDSWQKGLLMLRYDDEVIVQPS